MLGKNIELYGWVQVKREHGGIVFVDLRDRSGIVQLVFDENKNKELFNEANTLRSEYVIKAEGVVRERENPNPNIPTGKYEVLVKKFNVLNKSKPLPIQIIKQTEDSEEIRLKYRYLDLRRERMKNNILMRHKITSEIRKYLNENGFVDVETPFLTKSTPEGARDFLVPSRVNRGKFYALPQSPQIFKQLLMIAGFERYYQIVKCFRDEDLRADRQPEFTQLDIEMSFIDERDIYQLIDKMFYRIIGVCYNREVSIPFPKITYDEAMKKYGTDRPDMRFGLELKDVTEVIQDFKPKDFILNGLKEGKRFYTLVSPFSDKITRKFLDKYTEKAKVSGCELFSWSKVQNNESSGPLKKLFSNEIDYSRIKDIDNNDKRFIIFSCFGDEKKVQSCLGDLRIELGKTLDLINNNELNFIWITDFPLFEWSEEENKIVSVHHPFTSPKGDLENVENNKIFELKSRGYDLVLNGIELGGGSIRIHNPEMQRSVFKILGLSEKEIENKFGFLIKALEYGAPPHGGIAFGLDRMVMMLQGEDSIRDVIPFPKTASGLCPLTGAPDKVSENQLEELGLILKD